jgi:hypothetical protein
MQTIKKEPTMKKEPKYKRWVIDYATRCVLESLLDETDTPNATQLSSLACLFEVHPRRVQVWFQNQRQRKKQAEKEKEIIETREQREACSVFSALANQLLSV